MILYRFYWSDPHLKKIILLQNKRTSNKYQVIWQMPLLNTWQSVTLDGRANLRPLNSEWPEPLEGPWSGKFGRQWKYMAVRPSSSSTPRRNGSNQWWREWWWPETYQRGRAGGKVSQEVVPLWQLWQWKQGSWWDIGRGGGVMATAAQWKDRGE